MKRWLLAIVVVLLGFVIVSEVHAQATSGRLAGRITDDDERPLPGVTVTIQSDVEIGGSKATVTGADGRFVFVGLTPGEYTVRADLEGFGTEERRDVKVDLGGTSSLNITMSVARFEDEITVVAESPVIDTTQVNTEQVFSVDYLNRAAVGANNRSYQSVLTQAAGVAGGSNPNVFGSTMGENAYYVDGAETSDPVTGTWGVNFNFDAIQEIQFQTGGFEAQYGRSTGGLVNLVTKSGGNRFSGSVDLRYRDDSFLTNGEHFDKSERDEKFEDYGFTLGGPILRDKLWFFVAYEKPKTTFTPIKTHHNGSRRAPATPRIREVTSRPPSCRPCSANHSSGTRSSRDSASNTVIRRPRAISRRFTITTTRPSCRRRTTGTNSTRIEIETSSRPT
jgi:hypothetical protein